MPLTRDYPVLPMGLPRRCRRLRGPNANLLFDEIRNIPYCDFSGDAETSEFASFHKITWAVECCWSFLDKQRRLRCHSHSCGAEARQILVENSKIIIYRCFFGHLEQRVDISNCNILLESVGKSPERGCLAWA